MRHAGYWKVRGRYLTDAQAMKWLECRKRRIPPKPKPTPLTLVVVNIHREKPKTGTLLDYMEAK